MKSVWFEKHRPASMDEVMGQPQLHEELVRLSEGADLQHLLFHSVEAGTGKTSVARIIANARDFTLHTFNASTKRTRGIQFIEDEIIPLSRSGLWETIILLDEADRLTPQAQDALKGVIEDATCFFILTCNDLSKVSRWLQSRCRLMRFKPLPDEAVLSRLKTIAELEGCATTEDDLRAIVRAHKGDMRNSINALQAWYVQSSAKARERFILSLGEPFDVVRFLRLCFLEKALVSGVKLLGDLNTRQAIREVFDFAISSDNKPDKITKVVEACIISERDITNGVDEKMVRWDFVRMLCL